MGNLGSKPALVALTSGDLGADIVTAAKIADNVLNSEHYAAGSIDNEHLADNAAGTDEIADNAVTLAKMAGGTDGNIISYDASGNPVAIATGSDGQVLTSAGAGAPPAFEAAAAGKILQVVKNSTSALVTGSTTMPRDDTIPQNDEGIEMLTLAITPTSSSSVLVIILTAMSVAAEAAQSSMALFQDTTANALAASGLYNGTANGPNNHSLIHTMVAGTTSSTTFKMRIGANSGAIRINGDSGGRDFGGVASTSIVIFEYTP